MTTERFATGRFWPFTWKSINKNFVNYKLRPLFFCNHDSTHFFMLRVSANALYDCYLGIVDSFVFIHRWSRLFSSVKGYYVYMISKIIHGCLYIRNFSSRVQLDISLARCAYSWAIELNTRREIPYLRAPMCYSLLINRISVSHYWVWARNPHI